LPSRLKAEILQRQDSRCADCGTLLVVGAYVFDHRPPLALRDALADPNDPELVAVICRICDRAKTPRDLREIARVRRRGLTYHQFLELERVGAIRRDPQSSGLLAARAPGGWLLNSYERAVLEAEELWDLEECGLGSWPPFSKSDLR
jgi:hypothetical protein